MGNRLSEEKVTRIINNAGGAVGSVKEQYAAAYGEERPGTRQNLPRQPLNRHRVKPIRYCNRSWTTRGETAAPAVVVYNNTGGSAIVSSTQLGGFG